MAHTFACLRIAEAISGTGARLAYRLGRLTLSRAGFAPAGRQTKFHEGIVSSLPFDQHCLVALNFLYMGPGGSARWLGLPPDLLCRLSKGIIASAYPNRKCLELAPGLTAWPPAASRVPDD